MKKLATSLSILFALQGQAQTLFYYGHDSVSTAEFMRAYQKNNTGPKTAKSVTDYLDLYIASRLKIQEAKARGYDTLPQMVTDLENLRQQILPSYITDKESIDRLTHEAFERSQKDLHVAQIFISFMQGNQYDTLAAKRKLNQTLAALRQNSDFAVVARTYSDDPSAAVNGGDIGYITVFTLPYELENLAYNTPAGKTSGVFRSRAGYHIFRILGVRKALGRVKAEQILLAFPPNSTAADKAQTAKLADSLYGRIQKGDDLGKLAGKYSNDVVSATANGQMQEFGIGQYDPQFEQAVYSLKDGAVSKPFLTAHGYHIVKKLSQKPIPEKAAPAVMESLRQRVEQSDRMNTTHHALAEKILKQTHFTRAPFQEAELWAYSDSVLNYQKPAMHLHLNGSSTLFTLGRKEVPVTEWISYAQTFRYKNDGSGLKPYPQLWDEFLQTTALNYYQAHLEDFNEAFRRQINEFREGNLFFEVMQREIWGPAQADSAQLQQFYNQHRASYTWKKSADAVVFYASDEAAGKTYLAELNKRPSEWHNLITAFSEKIAADSARFEERQLPNPTKLVIRPGVITAPVTNQTDHTSSFAYVIKLYPPGQPRTYAEAKGLVINDYQKELEKNWVSELRKKYPVRVNERELDRMKKSI
jgi:peptidyl-prolyl cis-trans isomerase SurA